MPSILEVNTSGGTMRFRVALYTNDRGNPITIKVIHSRGEYIIRGWDHRLEKDPTLVNVLVVDHEAPLNERLRVLAIVGDGERSDERFITVPSATPLITDPLRGLSVPVTIQSWPEFTHERAGKVLEISDNRYPFIIDGFERAPVSTITLIHNVKDGSASALADLLESRSSLRIRPSCPAMEAAWVSARGRSRRPFSKREDSAMVDTIELFHTAMPDGNQQAIGNTLMDLYNAVPTTLLDISQRWPLRLIDISLEDLNA